MDLSDLPAAPVRRVPLAAWFRLQRAVEKTPGTLLALNRDSVLGPAAALALRMETLRIEWSRLLDAIDIEIEVTRCRQQPPRGKSLNVRDTAHVRLHLRAPFTG